LTPAESLASHRAFMAELGETVLVRRYSGAGAARSKVEASILARVMGYAPKDLVGTIVQGDRRVIALNDPAAVVPAGKVALASLLPLNDATDKLVIRGREAAIKAVDDNTRRIAGVLIALEIQAAG
jgi:hypothetical protein